MATHSLSPPFTSFEFDRSAARVSRPKRRLWRRIFQAMMEARQRQAEREIARYIERNGGKFTDSLERQIEHRFLSQ